jgi:hypothetical protein
MWQVKFRWVEGSELVFWTTCSIQIKTGNFFDAYIKSQEFKNTSTQKGNMSDIVWVYTRKHPKCFEHINYSQRFDNVAEHYEIMHSDKL